MCSKIYVSLSVTCFEQHLLRMNLSLRKKNNFLIFLFYRKMWDRLCIELIISNCAKSQLLTQILAAKLYPTWMRISYRSKKKSETIKWNAGSYIYIGRHRISIRCRFLFNTKYNNLQQPWYNNNLNRRKQIETSMIKWSQAWSVDMKLCKNSMSANFYHKENS